MHMINTCPGCSISIGRQGENNACQVRFDISSWIAEYGGKGTVQLIYQRPGDTSPYPVAVVRQENLILWTVTATDTANYGSCGMAELQYYIGDTLVKSKTGTVTVGAALGEPEEIPDPPGQTWLDQALQAGVDAQIGAAAADDAAKRAEEIVGNASWIAAEVNERGHLILSQADAFMGAEFALNENGRLEVTYT